MSRRESDIELNVDIQYSSGDSKEMKPKMQEENNNEIDELSKELTEMGCIVDAVKRPPNICVETCVYDSDTDKKTECNTGEINDDAYSDEFEDDKSEEESITIPSQAKSAMSESKGDLQQSFVKLTKSQSSVLSKKVNSLSGKSTDYGSISVPQTRRINMSFTNERLREIERHNHILLTRILSARNSRKSSIPPQEQPVRKPVPSAAVHRRNQQKRIDHDNMILLKKIQRAKSSAYSVRR